MRSASHAIAAFQALMNPCTTGEMRGRSLRLNSPCGICTLYSVLSAKGYGSNIIVKEGGARPCWHTPLLFTDDRWCDSTLTLGSVSGIRRLSMKRLRHFAQIVSLTTAVLLFLAITGFLPGRDDACAQVYETASRQIKSRLFRKFPFIIINAV